jgi:hypothetical protein
VNTVPILRSSPSPVSWSTARAKPRSCTSRKALASNTRRLCASTRCCPVPSGRACGRGRAASSIISSSTTGSIGAHR